MQEKRNDSAIGELKYFIGARLGRTHCALCDITHGLVRSKPEWRTCRERLPVGFDTFHRDDQPEVLRRMGLALPVVAAETDTGYVALLGPDELASCRGSVDALIAALDRSLRERNLEWAR